MMPNTPPPPPPPPGFESLWIADCTTKLVDEQMSILTHAYGGKAGV